jgi:hypothetical protein
MPMMFLPHGRGTFWQRKKKDRTKHFMKQEDGSYRKKLDRSN